MEKVWTYQKFGHDRVLHIIRENLACMAHQIWTPRNPSWRQSKGAYHSFIFSDNAYEEISEKEAFEAIKEIMKKQGKKWTMKDMK